MRNLLDSLNTLFSANTITPEMFYNISFGHNSLALQGKFDTKIVAAFTKYSFFKKFESEVTTSGFVEMSFVYLDIKVTVTLT